MTMEGETMWRDRCERYFTSISESERTQESGRRQSKDKEWQSLGDMKDSTSDSAPQFAGLKEWLRSINLHGLSFIGTSQDNLGVFVWTTITVIACGALVFFFYLNIVSYVTQSKTFVTESKTHESAVFPAVTLCNLNKMKSSLVSSINGNRFQNLLRLNNSSNYVPSQQQKATKDTITSTELFNLLISHMNIQDVNSLLDRLDTLYLPFQSMAFAEDWQNVHSSNGETIPNVLQRAVIPTRPEIRQLSHKKRDMIVRCSQGGEKCPEENYIEIEDPELGKCVTITNRNKALPGKKELILNIEPHEYIGVLTPSVGVKVYIHDHDEGIQRGSEAVVYPGSHLHINIQKVIKTHNQRPCNEDDTYNQDQCLYQCLDEMALRYCRCRHSFDSPFNQRCKVNVQFEYVCLRSLVYLQERNHLDCNCPTKCSYTNLIAEASSAYWPSKGHVVYLQRSLAQKGLSLNSTEIRSSLSYVTISSYFAEKEVIRETKDITILAFLSRIGGISALLTGASIITVIEAIWMLVRLCCFGCKTITVRAKERNGIQRLTDSEITSVTWQAYKNQRRLEVKEEEQATRRRNDFVHYGFRRSSCGTASNFPPVASESRAGKQRLYQQHNTSGVHSTLFPFSKATDQRRIYNCVTDPNKGDEAEFPIFNSLMEESVLRPRCSTPTNSEHRAKSKILQLEGDAKFYPEKGRIISPADAIQLYGKSSSKYLYKDSNYL